uniref:GTP cyclohydrolase II n=1 Tax=Florenciella parvula TaxID=236787 RepID=A0A7S2FI45_9STRA|eukprot:CAMPEP_0119467096 /NCGR_PEP_ID=MMETSP1344-20130328/1437_1 /TAXON_ID=236787 /ORGANISM="Florenciella parvula, Strain CCMP2471" /LENGTH=469 /DNA_ID=CAMNT_0007499439 /DNA_START=111 /DNA_END=1520 /DNA_ORIENTATION=-
MAAEEDNSTVPIPEPEFDDNSVITLTTHQGQFGADPIPIKWGAATSAERGPVIATTRHSSQRNAIGAHSGGYSVYKALAVATGGLDPNYMPKFDLTTPVVKMGPFPSWHDPKRIVAMDPYGHMPSIAFEGHVKKGYDIRPTIAITKAHIDLPECKEAIRVGRLTPDGDVLTQDGQSHITKFAVEPVWNLPGIAERFGCTEANLRETLFKETNMMYPELVTRPDLDTFLPPVGGLTVYVWGSVDAIPDENIPLTVRVHDECNGSDVFGSDICTCRPYLTHAIEECIKTAQEGGTGIVIYYRKEGRALGEVTKYLVYNMRKRQEGGDKAEEYFNCTQHVAGVTDTRFQALMPDPLVWLGVTKIHKLVSMSNVKYDAITAAGIEVVERVAIPAELVPADAGVEIAAKVFNGYEGGDVYKVDKSTLEKVVGRDYDYKKSDAEMVAQDGLDALKKSGAEAAAEGEPAAKRAKSS